MRSKHNNQISNTRNTRVTRFHTRDAQSARLFMTPCCGGFTLIEIMLALGVLGIGMVLVATLFPPAIMQARRADRNTMAMILSQNSKAALEIRSSMDPGHPIFSPSTSRPNEFFKVPIGEDDLGGSSSARDLIHTDDAEYAPREGAGWQALVRQLNGSEIYQFVVVPYLLSPVMDNDDDHIGERLTNVRDGQQYTYWDDSGSQQHIDLHNVYIRQSQYDGGIDKPGVDLHSSVMLIEKSDYSSNLANLRWLSIGSPVILDGRHNDDEPYLGHCVTVLDIRDYEFSTRFWAVELSDRIFDESHPDWDDDDEDGDGDPENDIMLERSVWVFAADAYGAQSPAIGSYVFTAVVR